jgi:polygalacturonase
MEKPDFDVLLPIFRDVCYPITDFGAVSDTRTDNKAAFEAAIEKCHNDGGGKVVVPRGVWYTGPIQLKSNVNLHLQSGAVIFFSSDYRDYPLIYTSFEGLFTYRCISPIYGKDLENVAITGKGIINGSGRAWRPVKKWKMAERDWNQLIETSGAFIDETGVETVLWPSERDYEAHKTLIPNPELYRDKETCEKFHSFLRPTLVNLTNCNRVLLDGPTFQNSPAWGIHPWKCQNLTIRNVSVRNPWFAQNADGLDIDSCKYVKVSNSIFDVGDDAICVKSGKNEDGRELGMASEYIDISNCIVYHGHGGFVAGSEMSGGLKNIYVHECTFIGTDIGLRFKSCLGRGGVVEKIYIDDINMIGIKHDAVTFNMGYDMDTKEGQEVDMIEVPEFKNIYINNVNCTNSAKPITIKGLSLKPIHDVHFSNMTIKSEGKVEITNAENIFQTNIHII